LPTAEMLIARPSVEPTSVGRSLIDPWRRAAESNRPANQESCLILTRLSELTLFHRAALRDIRGPVPRPRPRTPLPTSFKTARSVGIPERAPHIPCHGCFTSSAPRRRDRQYRSLGANNSEPGGAAQRGRASATRWRVIGQ
jgi:hypothetical protein